MKSARSAMSGLSASSVTITAAAPRSSSSTNPAKLVATVHSTPRSAICDSSASRPKGASISTRCSSCTRAASVTPRPSRSGALLGHSGEYAAVVAQRLADADAAAGHAELADRALVVAAALLDHRDGLAHLALGLEI